MKNFICLFLILISLDTYAQKKHNFKIMASFAGLGAAYEYNPASVVYAQGHLTSTFTVTRVGIQSKLALVRSQDFTLKMGVEGAYFLGDLRVGGFEKEYDGLQFMPLIAAEWKVVGIEVPFIVSRDFSSVFPVVAITLSVTNDEKSPRKKKK